MTPTVFLGQPGPLFLNALQGTHESGTQTNPGGHWVNNRKINFGTGGADYLGLGHRVWSPVRHEQENTEIVGNILRTYRKDRPETGKAEMHRLDFCQKALRERVAPESIGSVSSRIYHASKVTKLSLTRTRDIWYADSRISIRLEELQKIERAAGVQHERREANEVEAAIARATTLIDDQDENFRRALDAAMRTFISVFHRTGIEG